MSDVMDPMELLALADPVPDVGALAPTRSYLPAQRTLQRIVSRPAPEEVAEHLGRPVRPPRRGLRLVVAVAAATAAVVAAAAGTWVITARPADAVRVACYAAADLSADRADTTPGAGSDPVEACAEVWRTGPFAGWSGATPPALAACVLRSGVIGVFPGEPSVCDRLGLPRGTTEREQSDTLGAVQLIDTLTAAFAAPSCVDVATASDRVREELDRLGLVGWTLIAPASTEQGRPCASIAIDPPARTITLVPVPAPASG